MSAIKSIAHGANEPPQMYAFATVGISLIIKELMHQYASKQGKKVESSTYMSRARNRSYAYSSLLALVGIAGSLTGKYVNMPALYYLDPCASLVISLLVLRMSYRAAMEIIPKPVIQMEQEDSTELIAAVQNVNGVITVDSLKAFEQGHYVSVDIEVSVNPSVSVWEGHEIAKRVKRQLMKRFHHVSEVTVLVHPYDVGYPYKNTELEHGDYPSVIH
ncbi:cation diffusion facilitator family transporter [Paenibacillus sp. N3.4]|uniref:cation diffusion facilitator family transporter n=1 Tax=Paenibacillus sp. N3.4 TaxID=2603222 RepID=UPI0021C264E8|nr:cation diffusion facilitator family transporter [Paenibacillus sp. N3.4]